MRTALLRDILAALESGARPKGGASPTTGSIPSLGAENIREDGTFTLDNVKRVPEKFFAALRAGRIAQGDILVVKDGATTGKVAYVGSDFPFDKSAINEHVFRVALDKQVADARYVFHFLSTDEGKRQILIDFRGATVGGIGRSFVDTVTLPLPPLPEQRRIAAVLDEINLVIKKRRHALALNDRFIESVYMAYFDSSHSEKWPEQTVESLSLKIRTGPFGSQLRHSEFVDSGVAVLGIDNAVKNEFAWGQRRYITEKKYATLKRYTVYPEDVIITIMATCGRAAVVPPDIPTAISTKHLCSITLDKTQCLPDYLHATVLLNPRVLRQLGATERGAVMPGLNMQVIKELRLHVPPLNLQYKFAAVCSAMSRVKHEQRIHLDYLGSLKWSLRLDAFGFSTGSTLMGDTSAILAAS